MKISTLFTFLLALLLTACSALWGPEERSGVSSSMVDYLYPEGDIPPKYDSNVPNLQLPITVGLAFVPGSGHRGEITEAHKIKLLDKVKKEFSDREFIKEITVIPETYMRSARGFAGVDQIARLYGLDVVSLVSYDQVATTSDNKASLLYWTIVGAYFIKGTENQVTTFIDTAVFDVKSRKMLFRAPGVSENKKSTTLVEVKETYRETKKVGFELAMADMTQNLKVELDSFKEHIKEDENVTVTYREGYGGSGSISIFAILLLLGGLIMQRKFS